MEWILDSIAKIAGAHQTTSSHFYLWVRFKIIECCFLKSFSDVPRIYWLATLKSDLEASRISGLLLFLDLQTLQFAKT
jgi:hypothetical protein